MISVGGGWRLRDRLVVSVEGFYKKYGNIPLSVSDGIPLSCKGDDYGVVGNEALFREEVTEQQLIGYLDRVRAAVNAPVNSPVVSPFSSPSTFPPPTAMSAPRTHTRAEIRSRPVWRRRPGW